MTVTSCSDHCECAEVALLPGSRPQEEEDTAREGTLHGPPALGLNFDGEPA